MCVCVQDLVSTKLRNHLFIVRKDGKQAWSLEKSAQIGLRNNKIALQKLFMNKP